MKDKILFIFKKNIKTENKSSKGQAQGHGYKLQRGKLGVVDGKAEKLDKIIEWIEEKQVPELFGKDIPRIDDGGEKKQRLEDDGDQVLGIPHLDISHGINQGQPQGKEKMKEDDGRQPQQIKRQGGLQGHRKHKEDGGQDKMIDEPGQHIGERENDFWDVDLADERLVIDEGSSGRDHGLLDHRPGGEPGKKENDIVVDLKANDCGKNSGQNGQIKERIKYGPQKTKKRIPVAELELGDDQVPQKLSVEVYFSEFFLHCVITC